MDDYQTILYIIIGVIYLLARILKRKKPQVPLPKVEGEILEADEKGPERKRPLSFDQLIKEISGGKTPEEPETIAEPIKHEPISQPAVPDATAEATYEESIKTAKRLKKKSSKSKALVEEPRIFEEFDTEEGESDFLAEDIRRSLKNNWDIKKAIVINEILTRKYK